MRIVYVEDQEDDVELVRLTLQRAQLSADIWPVQDGPGLQDALRREPDVVLCDYHLPGFGAGEALALLQAQAAGLPLIVLTWSIGEDAVVELFRAGARDYVAKDKLALLPQAIERALRERAHQRERERVSEALARTNAHLRRVLSRVVGAQERERALIARELHDELGQTLTGVVLQLHAAARPGTDGAQAQALLQQALALTRTAVDQVRTLSFELRPAQLDLLGLPAAIRSTAERVLAHGDVGWTLQVRGRGPAPAQTPPQAAVALRVVREALTNVLRHSGASTVRIHLGWREDGRMALAIGDDGRGFDAPALLADGPRPHNVGLYGMIERCESVGGQLRLRSRPGAGTVIRALL